MVKYGIQSMSQITAIKRPTEVPEYVQEKQTTHTHTHARTHTHTHTRMHARFPSLPFPFLSLLCTH